MTEILLVAAVALLVAALILLVVLVVRRGTGSDPALLQGHLQAIKEALERLDRGVREELARNREESGASAKQAREEIAATMRTFGDTMGGRMMEISELQRSRLETFSGQLNTLTQSFEQRQERMRETVEERLKNLQEENSAKLEQMRATVDEKLHATLEQRLGESFRLVSERLEQVHKGLGEMQSLASGVGDLKKVLTNIKARGTFGEIQLGNLLEQVLAPEQFGRNVATRHGSNDRVEFAIRLPGREGLQDAPVWLPIDAKFPQEDYQRLVEAQDQANPAAVEEASRMLEVRVKNEARAIKEKYLDPPHTTDFAFMFLPTEGLFAEVIRRPGLFDILQREHRVIVAGPTTLLAVLNSLQMGFRTLAIEKRSSEVWSLLGAVKTEFGRFGEILDKTRKKLEEASTTIDNAATRSRAIERKLKDVQQLPSESATRLLGE